MEFGAEGGVRAAKWQITSSRELVYTQPRFLDCAAQRAKTARKKNVGRSARNDKPKEPI